MMLCGNCGHDERVHREDDEHCTAHDCRCSEFENWDEQDGQIDALLDQAEEAIPEGSNTVKFVLELPRVHVPSFLAWLQAHDPEADPPEKMKIPDTIRTIDLDLDNPETRKWLAEKIRSEN